MSKKEPTKKNAEWLVKATQYIDEWMQLNYDNSRLPGVSVAVQYKDDVIFSGAYGYAHLGKKQKLKTGHVFRVASHSKTFTATAIMQLHEGKKLRLDDKISEHLPWFVSSKDARVKDVTVRHILNHVSGIIRDGDDCDFWSLKKPFASQEELKEYIKTAKLIKNPSEQFKYSNFAYSYLGMLIEELSGETYANYMMENIVKKLGLKNTFPEYISQKKNNFATGHTSNLFKRKRKAVKNVRTHGMAPATGFCSTAEDLCTFFSTHMLGNTTLITDASKYEMQNGYWAADECSGDRYGYGFDAVKAGGETWIGHSGGFPGFITNTKFCNEKSLTISVLTNAWNGAPRSITMGIIEIINHFEPDASTNPSKKLNKFEGTFYAEWGIARIINIGGKLYAADPRNWNDFSDAEELEYVSSKKLLIKRASGYSSPGEDVEYHFSKSGKVHSIRYAGITMLPWEKYRKTL